MWQVLRSVVSTDHRLGIDLPKSRVTGFFSPKLETLNQEKEPLSVTTPNAIMDTSWNEDNAGSQRIMQRLGESESQTAISDSTIEDVYIAVMDVTGSGKSSLIRSLTGYDVPIGHDLQPSA